MMMTDSKRKWNPLPVVLIVGVLIVIGIGNLRDVASFENAVEGRGQPLRIVTWGMYAGVAALGAAVIYGVRRAQRPRCPACREALKEGARVCRFCGEREVERVGFRCPACGYSGPMSPELVGQSVECPSCQRVVTAT